MKDTKLEIPSKKDVQLRRESPNQSQLEGKSESEIKNTSNKTIKMKKALNKCSSQQDKANIMEKGFLDYKNLSGKDLNYKGKKGNIKRYNRISSKKYAYLIIAMIFFNLIMPNNNNIEYKFSNITLKVRGPASTFIFGPYFLNLPNRVYINEIQDLTITNRYTFNKINNTVN